MTRVRVGAGNGPVRARTLRRVVLSLTWACATVLPSGLGAILRQSALMSRFDTSVRPARAVATSLPGSVVVRRVLLCLGLLLLAGACPANAQGGVYQLNYFDNASLHNDQKIRIVNTGEQGSPLDAYAGTVCADIYVFDANQEMVECCACKVTANANFTISLNAQLIQRPLTGTPVTSGSIHIIGDKYPGCNEAAPQPTSGLLASKMQVQVIGPDTAPVPWATETSFQFAQLSDTQRDFLGAACNFVQYLGGRVRGKCICGLMPGS